MNIIELDRKNNIVRFGAEEFAKFSSKKSLIKKVFGNEEKQASKCFIEILLPLHVGSYGLIGYEFIPDNGNEFTVEILINEEKILLQDTMSHSKSDTYIGINEEYANIIMEGVLDNLASNELPKGKLKICMGAYSEVCSSPIIFSIITNILMECFFKGYTENEMKNICEKYLALRFT